MDAPSLLEEFATGLDVINTKPALVTMANAKWIAPLLGAIVESGKGDELKIQSIALRYSEIAKKLLTLIGGDNNDPRLINTAMQAIIKPATREIRETGTLTGDWLKDYSLAIAHTPAFFKVTTSPVSAATSLGMTLSNHYADLYAMVNDFAFLKDPAEVVVWANAIIDTAAKESASIIAPHEDHGSAYQNQLNVNRTLFKSVYKSESKPWKEMLADNPQTAALYASGLPLSGIETRFAEQTSAIKEMLNINGHKIAPKYSR
jgi:hypothetical protein